MAQHDFGTMDPDVESGSDLASDLNNFRDAVNSSHKGSSRPSYAIAGTLWINDTSTPWVVNVYDGSDDIPIGTVNATTNQFVVNPLFLEDVRTGDYTITTAEAGRVQVANKSSAITFSLPAAATAGAGFLLPYKNIGAGALTLDGDGSETIDGAGTLVVPQDAGGILYCNGTAWKRLASSFKDDDLGTLMFVIDGGGSVISTGVKGFLGPFDVPITIAAATLLADQAGSMVVDVWSDTYANYPPTVADTITASAKPTLSSATKSQDTTLTGWTKQVPAGNVLGFNVDSCSTITRATIALKYRKGLR